MKHFSYYLLLCLLIVGNVQAQGDQNFIPKTTFGIKGGVNALAIKYVNEGNESVPKGNSGIYLGAFVNFPTSEGFSIQPEVNYASGEHTYNDKINLLHIPILLKLEIGEGFTGFIGPESVILLKLEEDNPFRDKFKKIMFGFTFGLGYNFTDNFSVEARPYFSINKFKRGGLCTI